MKRCALSSHSLDSSRSSELPRRDRRRGNDRRACQPGSSSPMFHRAGCDSGSGSLAADTRDLGAELHGYTAKGSAYPRCNRTQDQGTRHANDELLKALLDLSNFSIQSSRSVGDHDEWCTL